MGMSLALFLGITPYSSNFARSSDALNLIYPSTFSWALADGTSKKENHQTLDENNNTESFELEIT